MVGKNSSKVLLAVINAYYDSKNGYAHCSINEINRNFGISLKNMPEIFRQLEADGYIKDCTISGYYKRFKILNPYLCPDFILDNRLNTSQKNFLLKCLENDINDSLSKKEICRRVNNNENISNLNTITNKIEKAVGDTFISILKDVTYISGLIPENSIYTEFGYRTTLNRKNVEEKSIEDRIANFLHDKSYQGYKHRKNIQEYKLSPEIIKNQLLKQEMKDYYTGIIPDDYMEYSVDRLDSSKGYIEGNIVITTNTINIMKNNLSLEEFKKQIKLLYNNINNY